MTEDHDKNLGADAAAVDEGMATSADTVASHADLYVSDMRMRDYFAAKAMAAIIAVTWTSTSVGEPHVAEWAYVQADAMLKARESQ